MMLNSLYTTFSYSGSDISREAGTAAIWFVGAIVFICLLCLAGQILLGLAVYNDAKAKANTEPVMWGVLTGIFGAIPAIIYLCVRNSSGNKLIICPNCGWTHRIADFNCPQCGVANPFSQQFVNPLAEIQKRKAKKLLIATIIAWAVAIILGIISTVWFVTAIINMQNLSTAY